MMTLYPFRFFGAGTLIDPSGEIVAPRSRKQLALLVYLVSEHQTLHSRDTLMALLWPDEARLNAQNNLRFTLSQLRSLGEKLGKGDSVTVTTQKPHPSPPQKGGDSHGVERVPPLWGEARRGRSVQLPFAKELLQSDRQAIQISPEWVMRADVNHFQQLVERTRQHSHSSRLACEACQQALAQAVQLYQGEFLAGFGLDDCPAFEEWLFMQRERLHVLVCEAYSELAASTEAKGDLNAARGFVQRQIELDPLREPAYRQQMRILTRQGERSAALAVFERCRSLLNEELGLDPEPETLALHLQILNADAPANPSGSPTESRLPTVRIAPPTDDMIASTSPRHNLPQQLTPFIGREEEMVQLQQRLVNPAYRLLSIIGPGGIGKSRLAIQVAAANQHLFADGVCFVPLAGVQRVEAIPAAIMDALGTSFEVGAASPTSQLLKWLSDQNMLLLIDNFEHLIEGVDLLLAILQTAPNVTLLVTTREQLNCQAEDSFTLDGLATPTQSALQDASHYAAVRLFCERAYRLNKGFKLTVENCPSVVRICQLVEGMPLAIELATTWIEDFSCADLSVAIAQNQSILATTQRDLPARHRSMQAVFDYSWQLLTTREQRILSQLALCHGRFSTQIAGHLTGASLIDLTGLRYKSLLRIADVGYYDLHPLIRGFAVATLDSATQRQAEERLATIYLQQVAAQAVALTGATPQVALHLIERQLDNVQQAWRWAVTNMRIELLLQSVDALGDYYAASGRNAECETSFLPLLQQLLAQPTADERSGLLCLHLLDKVARALTLQSKHADAQGWAIKLVALAQKSSNREFEARGLYQWGDSLIEEGQHVAARQKFVDALRFARPLAQPRLLSNVLLDLGISLSGSDTRQQAESYLHEALTIQRSQGNRAAEQRTLLYLGVNCLQDGDFQAGRNYLAEARHLLQLTGNRPQEARIVNALGYSEAMVGDYANALAHHAASRRISQEIRQPSQESHALHNLCTVQRKVGNLDLALEDGEEALRLALVHDLADAAHFARLHLGYVWLALNDPAQAIVEFQLAQEGWQAAGRDNRVQEARLGLAAAAFQQGNLTLASALIAPVLPILLEQVPDGMDEPYENCLACYQILRAVGDERANVILATAYRQLERTANKITELQLRHRFWQVPAHRKIFELWNQQDLRTKRDVGFDKLSQRPSSCVSPHQ